MNFYRAGGILCLLPATYRLYACFSGRFFFRVLPMAGCICLMLFGLPEARSQSPERQEAVAGGKEEIKPLKVGEKVPEEFWTKEHLFYIEGDTVRKNLEEFRGKLLILDFWASWCGACKSWFSNNSQLQKEYGNGIKILLVNSDTLHDDLIKIDKVLSDHRYFEEKNGQSIIYDSYLKNFFPYFSIPLYIWIDSGGMIRAITTFDFVSSSQIKTLLNRKQFSRWKGDKGE